MPQPQWGSPKRPNYEEQAIRLSYQKAESDQTSNDHTETTKKFNVIESTVKLRADQVSDADVQTSSREESRSTELQELQRRLVERQKRQTDLQAKNLKEASEDFQQQQQDIAAGKDVSHLDHKIASDKLRREQESLGNADLRIKRGRRPKM